MVVYMTGVRKNGTPTASPVLSLFEPVAERGLVPPEMKSKWMDSPLGLCSDRAKLPPGRRAACMSRQTQTRAARPGVGHARSTEYARWCLWCTSRRRTIPARRELLPCLPPDAGLARGVVIPGKPHQELRLPGGQRPCRRYCRTTRGNAGCTLTRSPKEAARAPLGIDARGTPQLQGSGSPLT
jgi:hypothetical protein